MLLFSMDRAREAEQMRNVVIQTIFALLIAAALLVLTYLWLFKKLLS
jgi:hypothetical protein